MASKKPEFCRRLLEKKRRNAKILRDKGFSKERMYEVRGISHSGGESLPNGRRGDIQILDMSKLMENFIDMLDAWADKGVEPPATRSDWAELGDLDKDGTIENAAIAVPDVACPLGVYFSFPNSTAGTTSFAAFTGTGIEPPTPITFCRHDRNGVWTSVRRPRSLARWGC